MKKRKINFPIKLIVSAILGFFIVCLIIGYLIKTLKNLDYFRIRDIIVKDQEADEFLYLKGRNIFNLDLNNESKYISELYPTYKKIRLVRVLPDRLFIDFIRRQGLACIKLYRYFCVDEEGVLFDLPDQFQEPDLPIILGLETKIFGAKKGQRYNIRELQLALNIIKEINKNKALKDYKIKSVDVANLSSASFFIEQNIAASIGLEVKLGEDNINNKIDILPGLLIQVKKDLGNIRYIDLRFKEPVIKFKNVQQ